MKKLQVRKDFEWSTIGSYRNGNPYTIIFVYPHPDFGIPYIIKGGSNDTDKYLNKVTLYVPAMVYKSWWWHGDSRGMWRLKNVNAFIIKNHWKKCPKKYTLRVDTGKLSGKILKHMRRIPRKWIKELDPYINLANQVS